MFQDYEFDAEQVESVLPEYKFIKKLGVGSYGKVFLVQKKDQLKQIAMKKIKCFGLCDYQRTNATNQVRILASLDHSNIIKFYQSLFDNTQEDLYIFMQYANEGDLSQLINEAKEKKRRISESLIWKIIYQLADGLNYLHKNNIVHRDIKPANIFKADQIFKLGDLNVSKILPPGFLAKTQIGSPLYTSPEIWNSQNGYNQKCDIWSLGVVIYQLCTLRVPYEAYSIEQLIRRFKTQRLKNIPNGYSSALNELIHQMLQANPKKRISAERILQVSQQQGKYTKEEQTIETYAEIMLETIVLPESEQRWVNLVPLPPKMIKKETTQSIKRDTSKQKSKQKRQFGLNRSNIFCLNQTKATLSRRSLNKNNCSQQKIPKVRLPSITKRNSSQEDERKSREKNIQTPQISRKQIQSAKINNKSKIVPPIPSKKQQNYIKSTDENIFVV